MSASKAAAPKVVHEPRKLGLLMEVGAVSEAQAKLMKRAAVLLAEKPLEPEAITVTAEALEQLSLPQVAKSLFTKEKRMRNQLWKALEWEAVVPAAPPLEVPPPAAIDVSKVQLRGDTNVRIKVEALPPNLQELARRVQLVCKDQNEDGILIANVEEVANNPVFPVDEREQLMDLRRILIDQIATNPPTMMPILDMPYPGIQRHAVEHSGSTPVFIASDVEIAERATYTGRNEVLTTNLTMQQTLSLVIEVPEGEQVILMSHEPRHRNNDLLLNSGTHDEVNITGLYRMERWKDGERLESSDINFPRTGRTNTQDMSACAGYQLRYNRDPIPRVLTDCTDMTAFHSNGRSSVTAQIRYSFDLPQGEPIDEVFNPKKRLEVEPGRYQVGKDLVIDVFASGAVRAKLGDFSFSPLRFNNGYSGDVDVSDDEDDYGAQVNIDLEGHVRVARPRNKAFEAVNADLTPKMRVN